MSGLPKLCSKSMSLSFNATKSVSDCKSIGYAAEELGYITLAGLWLHTQ